MCFSGKANGHFPISKHAVLLYNYLLQPFLPIAQVTLLLVEGEYWLLLQYRGIDGYI